MRAAPWRGSACWGQQHLINIQEIALLLGRTSQLEIICMCSDMLWNVVLVSNGYFTLVDIANFKQHANMYRLNGNTVFHLRSTDSSQWYPWLSPFVFLIMDLIKPHYIDWTLIGSFIKLISFWHYCILTKTLGGTILLHFINEETGKKRARVSQ